MVSKLKLSAMAFAILSLSAHGKPLPETLLKAVHQAVLTNPDVLASWNGFKAAGSEQNTARAGYLPQIDVVGTTGRESRTTASTDVGSYNVNSSQITLNQMLFDGRFTANEVKRLGFVKLTRYYELAEVSETTALEALSAYVDVVRYRELVDVATQNYVEHKQTALQLEERSKAGVGRRSDFEQVNGRLALSESNLQTELTSLHDASARYLRVVGSVPPAQLPPLPEPFLLAKLPNSTPDLMREGLQGSPTLRAALENARAYQQATESGRAAFLPRLNLRAYQSGDKNLAGVTGSTNVNGIELLLNDNLYRGGADAAKQRQTVNQKDQARDLQETACRDVRQTLSVAYSDMRRLSEQQRLRDVQRLATEKSREAYRQQFDIGQRTLLDLLDTQGEYFGASRAYINARYSQIAAQARTLAGMGQLVAALGAQRADVPTAQEAGQDHSTIDQTELCPLDETDVDTVDAIKARLAAPVKRASGPGSYVVLIPSPDGSIGRVAVQGKHGQKMLTKANEGVATDGAGAAFEVGKAQLERDFGAAMAALPPLPERFVFYFNQGSTELTPESKALLPGVLARARAHQAPDIWLVGHTDTTGKLETNEALGLKRAQALATQFQKMGIQNMTMSIESYGQRNPAVVTPDKTSEPLNRRGEITLR